MNNMKRIVLALGLVLILSTQAIAADVWSYYPKTINKVGDKVLIRVSIYFNGAEYYGRELTFNWADIKDLTVVQLRDAISVQVQYVIDQQNLDHAIKEKLKPYMNTEIILP